ncbi:MAG: Ig-like domain-containing protein [Pseudomonadota bacterium]
MSSHLSAYYSKIFIIFASCLIILGSCGQAGDRDSLGDDEVSDDSSGSSGSSSSTTASDDELAKILVGGAVLGIPASTLPEGTSVSMSTYTESELSSAASNAGISIGTQGSSEYAAGVSITLGDGSSAVNPNNDLYLAQSISDLSLDNYDTTAIPGGIPGATENGIPGVASEGIPGFFKVKYGSSSDFTMQAIFFQKNIAYNVPIYLDDSEGYIIFVLASSLFQSSQSTAFIALYAVASDSHVSVQYTDSDGEKIDSRLNELDYAPNTDSGVGDYESDYSGDGDGDADGDSDYLSLSNISPSSGETGITIVPSITLTFDRAININTLTVNTNDTECDGTFQLYTDYDSSTCVEMSTTYSVTSNFTSLVLSPATSLSNGTTYYINLTTDIEGADGSRLQDDYTVNFTTIE